MKNFLLLAIACCTAGFAQVGVGTNNPQKLLHINTTTNDDGLRIASTSMFADFRLNSTNFTFHHSIDAGSFTIRLGNIDRLVITNSQMNPVTNATSNTVTNGYDLGNFTRHYRRLYTQGIHTNDNDPNGGLRINIGSGGNTTADYMFSDFALFPLENGVKDLGRNGNSWNNFYFRSAFNTSDRRLKTAIKESPLGLSFIEKLQTYQYQFKDDKQAAIHYGFMAQDIQLLAPELVSEGDNPEKSLAVNYTEIIPILVKAMQEQQKQIEELKLEIKALKKN